MSRTEWRRPIRLLPPQQCAPAPAETTPVQASASSERFRRALGNVRRTESPAVSRAPAPAPSPAAPRAPAQGESGTRPVPRELVLALLAARLPDLPDEPAPSPRIETAPVAASVTGHEPPAMPVPEHRGWAALSGAGASDGDEWPRAMAEFITTLFTRADPAFRTWSVTVPLDPQTLPDAELQMNLSPHWLQLRFRTSSPQSVDLISCHRMHLVSLLEKVPSLPQGIDVDIE